MHATAQIATAGSSAGTNAQAHVAKQHTATAYERIHSTVQLLCCDRQNALVSRDVFSSLCNVFQVVWANDTGDGVPLSLHGILGVSNVLVFFVDS